MRRLLALLLACVLLALVQKYVVVHHSGAHRQQQMAGTVGPGCTPTTCQHGAEADGAAARALAAETSTTMTRSLASSEQESISCPTYSGPLFRKDTAQFASVRGAKLASPYKGTPAAPRGWLQPFPLSAVHLLDGSRQWRSMRVNLDYLLSLEPDTLLWSWRRNANLRQPIGARAAGGWEAPDMELRGHFLGHWLSATAFQWASSNDTRLERRMRYVVGVMSQVARALGRGGSSGGGYLSAFPPSHIERFERQQPVWAPYYCIHKV